MAVVKGTNNAEGLGGTNGNDVVFAYEGNDFVYGFNGNDVLKGGGGADELHGGAGRDTADYSDSDVGVQASIAGGGGSLGTADGDKFFEIEDLSGSQHDDILEGDENANALYGDFGNDVLKGGGGAGRLDGGGGNDQLNSDAYGDRLDGGTGIDTAYFKGTQYGIAVNLDWGFMNVGPHVFPQPQGTLPNIVNIEHVQGSNKNDTIIGDDAKNHLYGNDGDDRMWGGAGDDAINGGAGKDLIEGGAGKDSLIGGAGDDTFVFNGNINAATDTGKDTVKGFSVGHDHVQFDDAIFDSFADVKAHMAEVNGSAVITIDADTTVTILNVKVASLSASDFLFS